VVCKLGDRAIRARRYANAFLMERYRFPGKHCCSVLMLVPLVIPGVISYPRSWRSAAGWRTAEGVFGWDWISCGPAVLWCSASSHSCHDCDADGERTGETLRRTLEGPRSNLAPRRPRLRTITFPYLRPH